jgi:hypothetical protein
MKQIYIFLTILGLLYGRAVSAQCNIEMEQQVDRKLAFASKEPLYQNTIENQLYTIVIGSFGMKSDTSNFKMFVVEIVVVAPITNPLLPNKLLCHAKNGETVTLSEGEGQKEKLIETPSSAYSKRSYYFYLDFKQANFLLSNPIKTIDVYDPRRQDNGFKIKLHYASLLKDQLNCIDHRLQ